MADLPLRLALFYEGNSDRHFLPTLIYRTVDKIRKGRTPYELDIYDVEVVNEWSGLPSLSGAYRNRVLEGARRAFGYDALVIHRDADSSGRNAALDRYIEPAKALVNGSQEAVCKTLIPIIPIRSIEAWMLADANALHTVTETNIRPEQLGLPATPQQVESVHKPKDALRQAIETARGSRRRGRREMDINDLYADLAQQINLSLLEQVPSYKQFCEDVEQTLIQLNKITP